MRLTKIVCTLGPSSDSPEAIYAIAKEGMNVARINFSHGSEESHRALIQTVRQVNEAHDLSIALLLDTNGSDIRTGDIKTPLVIAKGQEVVFSSSAAPGKKEPHIQVSYDAFAKDVQQAECIIVDNGTMIFDVVKILPDGGVVARSRDDGEIGSRRHINLPGAFVSLPALTEKDWQDLTFGIEERMDMAALSFIRTAEEVQTVRKYLQERGSTMRLISKIETRHAVDNIDTIIAASDGIMVARGDLGVEIPFERVPAIQDMIVQKCIRAGKPVIVATHMLESMIEHPIPTRAEVTDIAHAVTTRADATMLSGETAKGEHPVEAVRAMARIQEETESHMQQQWPFHLACPLGERHALAEAAVRMAFSLRAAAILVLTRTGKTAQTISTLRPMLPIIALTESADVERALHLSYGVFPHIIAFDRDPEETVKRALDLVREQHLVSHAQNVVIVTDAKTHTGTVRTVQVRTVDA